ncbi:MAG TPA: isoprenylcysteine carboxylmethyltransferase family protein [Opitutaceae bacterium]|nr:isoprenylcysteine carboxylmethyltransferase family protein [Opitutaceae bacterium]
MRATDFEFRYRFWLIVLLHCVAFSLYYFDHISFGAAVLHLLAPPAGRGWLHLVYGFGAGLVFAGALLRTWATAYMRAEVVHGLKLHAHTLVADGPYRHMRNPLYFGVMLMAAGLGVMASGLGWIFLTASIYVYLLRLIRREEAELREAQGESYAAYCRSVPAFFPSLRPRLPAGGRQPRWRQAFVSELFIWIYGLAELVFAVTLRGGPTLIFIGAGFTINALAIFATRGRPQPAQA